MARRSPPLSARAKPRPAQDGDLSSAADDGDAELAAWLGEWLRRMALGLTAALVTARAFWPSEVDVKADGGTGLDWDLSVLMVAGLAVASILIGGVTRLRLSWSDLAVVALVVLVGVSAGHAYDRRLAINLAWDWGAVAIAYVLVRNLPRTRGESVVLGGTLVATAVAVAAYGVYQSVEERPAYQANFRAHKVEILHGLGIEPGSQAAAAYEDRVLGSNEPIATFALANSLAGFLVGPLVLMLAVAGENLLRREGRTSRWASLILAVPMILAVLICLIMTKSRSAWVGLVVGMAVLAWHARRKVSARTLALAALAGVVVVGVIAAGALAKGQLDRQVLTESTKSLRYRWEYWVGAWRVITDRSTNVFWQGHGPGNFTSLYLRHKLPQSSEEILDPHNMLLETWATAGLPALVALLVALGAGFWTLLRPVPAADAALVEAEAAPRARKARKPDDPPLSPVWLLFCAGAGWIVVALVGDLNPFEQFGRWLILGVAWLGTALLGFQLWRRVPISPVAFGAAVAAVAVNLLAAGGIGMPAVALMLWLLLGIGLNLSDDRAQGRLRLVGGRAIAFSSALVWAALVGIFAGAILPFWRLEWALADASAALEARPPRFEAAEKIYYSILDDHDKTYDPYSARPWTGLAYEKLVEWRMRGAKVDDLRWKTIPYALANAVTAPRNPYSWTMHHQRAKVMQQLLAELGPNIKPRELITYQANVVEATRRAVQLYPTNASLHAELADASARVSKFDDAAKEAHEALRYDALTPHLNKKLTDPMRKHLNDALPSWEKSAAEMNLPTEPPNSKP